MRSGPDCSNPAFACSIWKDLLFYGIHCFINPCVVFPFVILYLDDSQANWNPDQSGCFMYTSRVCVRERVLSLRCLCCVPGGRANRDSDAGLLRTQWCVGERGPCEIWAQKTRTAEGWKGTTTSSQCLSESCQTKVEFMLNTEIVCVVIYQAIL